MKPTIDELRAMAERVAKARAADASSYEARLAAYEGAYGPGDGYGAMLDDQDELSDFACEMLLKGGEL
jgi:hypothetical protein